MNNRIRKLVRLGSTALLLLVMLIAFAACGNDTVAVTSISINGENTATVNVAEQYSVTITPTNATNQEVSWEVVSGTATINEDGLLTATATGTVIIKATADGKSDTKQITVNAAVTPFGVYEYSTTVESNILTNRLVLNEDNTGRYYALLDGVELGGHYSHDITFSIDGNNLSYTIGDEPPISGTFSNDFSTLTLEVDSGTVVMNKIVGDN